MNTPITRMYGFVLVMFATLVGFTSNWAIFDAEELRQSADNRRPLLETQQIKRGTISSVDGEVIAESIQRGRGETKRYVRNYPLGDLFGNPIGYSFITEGATGLEATLDDTLIGRANEFTSIVDQLRGKVQEGSNVTTTLDAGAQRVAVEGLAGRNGSVVAIEPQTGAVRAMVSVPGFDPNLIPTKLAEFNQDKNSPLFNRATQSTYPPGSTMKVVTASAALDSGGLSPESTFDASSPQTFSGVPLANAGNAQFGVIDMRTALTNSVNVYFAQVAEEIGPETLVEYINRFGFQKDPQLPLPDTQMAPSGIYSNGKLVESGFDIARVGIGQGGEEGQLQATPTQMAEVAATIANGGTLMRPQLVQEVVDPDGRVSEELDPDEQSEVISEENAQAVAEMMTSVAEEGTASALSLGATSFAGKTGTAEIDIDAGLNQVWFIGFAPVEDPQVAIAVTVERCTGCFGGDTAGPIAISVMQELLG